MITVTMDIDWAILRADKYALLQLLDDRNVGDPAMLGLLEIIDHIQDQAVAQGVNDEEVFGPVCKTCGGYVYSGNGQLVCEECAAGYLDMVRNNVPMEDRP